MKPKKQFGQNFLMNKNVVGRMVVAAEIKAGETVLEIGPGKGVLTEALLLGGAKVFAVEKDRDLISGLKEKFAKEIKNKKLTLIQGDVRDISLSRYKLRASGYKLVANIPYYITGEILRTSLENKIYPSKMVLMVQKEVARRIMARDGKESILAVSIKAYGKPSIITYVGRGNFNPVPNVDSAIIKIDCISKDFFKGFSPKSTSPEDDVDRANNPPEADYFSEKRFFEILKTGFSHKRKFLSSNLSKMTPSSKLKTIFSEIGLSNKIRPENLTILDWKNLILGLK